MKNSVRVTLWKRFIFLVACLSFIFCAFGFYKGIIAGKNWAEIGNDFGRVLFPFAGMCFLAQIAFRYFTGMGKTDGDYGGLIFCVTLFLFAGYFVGFNYDSSNFGFSEFSDDYIWICGSESTYIKGDMEIDWDSKPRKVGIRPEIEIIVQEKCKDGIPAFVRCKVEMKLCGRMIAELEEGGDYNYSNDKTFIEVTDYYKNIMSKIIRDLDSGQLTASIQNQLVQQLIIEPSPYKFANQPTSIAVLDIVFG